MPIPIPGTERRGRKGQSRSSWKISLLIGIASMAACAVSGRLGQAQEGVAQPALAGDLPARSAPQLPSSAATVSTNTVTQAQPAAPANAGQAAESQRVGTGAGLSASAGSSAGSGERAANTGTVVPASAEPTWDGREGRDLLLSRFRPRPTLRVRQTLLKQARFPVVDVHTHFGIRLRGNREQLASFVEVMDRNRIAVCCSLDGGLGDAFREHADYLWKAYPDRFLIFANIDWQGTGSTADPASWDCQRPDFGRRMARALAEAKAMGASGLKIFKQFGLTYRDADGSPLKIDDPRWDPIWEACGQLQLPVLIHTADPIAFFQPIDETNERWEELYRHPDWSFHGPQFPRREALLEARNRVIARHPKTIFIGAHVANSSEDLAQVSTWLDQYPNLVIEFASRIGELGRQPYTARDFFLKYQDRILFGTDGPWPEARLQLYWRFLETRDEYFPYSEKDFPPQGFWNIYGISLPDEVLQKIYHGNALRILPGLKAKLAAQKLTVPHHPTPGNSP